MGDWLTGKQFTLILSLSESRRVKPICQKKSPRARAALIRGLVAISPYPSTRSRIRLVALPG